MMSVAHWSAAQTDARLAEMVPVLRRALLLWVPLAVAITGLAALVYGAVQQDLRQGADDPQIQLAEDAASRLAAGLPPDAVVPSEAVDMADSLAPYVMVFDRSGVVLASTVTLGGRTPAFPTSVFDSVRDGHQNRITWQPVTGVRSAVVIQPWRAGFVVTGRSLRVVEERVDQIGLLTGAVWLLTLGASAVAALVVGAVYEWPPRRSAQLTKPTAPT